MQKSRTIITILIISLLTVSLAFAVHSMVMTPLSHATGTWKGTGTLKRSAGELKYNVFASVQDDNIAMSFQGRTSDNKKFSFTILFELYSYTKNESVFVIKERELLEVEKLRESYDIPIINGVIEMKVDRDMDDLFISFLVDNQQPFSMLLHKLDH